MLHIFARKYYITAFDANKLPWIAILGRELIILTTFWWSSVGYFPTSRSSIPFARKGVLYFDPSKTKKNSLDPFPGFS